MTCTDKDIVEGSFNLKKTGNNTMHTLFYFYNISEFAANLEGIIDEGKCKTTIQNMYELGWMAQYFKYSDVSMFGHGCGVSQYPQFYDANKKIQILPCPYMGSYLGEKGRQFLHKPWILALSKSVEILIFVSISDMQTMKYWQNLRSTMYKAK